MAKSKKILDKGINEVPNFRELEEEQRIKTTRRDQIQKNIQAKRKAERKRIQKILHPRTHKRNNCTKDCCKDVKYFHTHSQLI